MIFSTRIFLIVTELMLFFSSVLIFCLYSFSVFVVYVFIVYVFIVYVFIVYVVFLFGGDNYRFKKIRFPFFLNMQNCFLFNDTWNACVGQLFFNFDKLEFTRWRWCLLELSC